jgi:hypothetical protein
MGVIECQESALITRIRAHEGGVATSQSARPA